MSQANWFKVADHNTLPNNQVMVAEAGEERVCLVHYQGQYYAIHNTCPHQGVSLGLGRMDNGYVVCPMHGWEFSPIDGSLPDYYLEPPIPTYPVEVRDDGIYVQLNTGDTP